MSNTRCRHGLCYVCHPVINTHFYQSSFVRNSLKKISDPFFRDHNFGLATAKLHKILLVRRFRNVVFFLEKLDDGQSPKT
jgi:hypothetical protein